MTQEQAHPTEIATLAGGCFWCLEAVYEQLRGVEQVVNGYAGGSVPHPTYEQVCTGMTGHTEVVQVTFDPALVSYRDLVRLFFEIHDPTTLNRQWPDVGTQYRSAIYWHTPEQERVAREIAAEAQSLWDRPIVTEIAPLDVFYVAEDYHQQYYRTYPDQGYCRAIIAPKVAKLRKEHLAALKA